MAGVAVVTGGTRGIGLAIARKLIAEGFDVAAIYHGNEEAAAQFRAQTGGKTFKLDVADYEACEKTAREIERSFDAPVRVLVNNAGITRDVMLHKMALKDWHEVIETNLSSCFNMCRAIVPSMRENGFGRIVNISSINGQKGQFGQTNYCAAKAGILGFTKALALESAAKGITVNAICPGYIKTDMTARVRPEVLETVIKQIPVARMGEPDEIAALVAFLVSAEAGFITGATLTANGGQYMV